MTRQFGVCRGRVAEFLRAALNSSYFDSADASNERTLAFPVQGKGTRCERGEGERPWLAATQDCLD